MTEARIARKCAVVMMGDAYFEYENPVAFARLIKWRKRKTLFGMLEEKMEAVKAELKRKLYEDLYVPMPVNIEQHLFGLSPLAASLGAHAYAKINNDRATHYFATIKV